MLGKEYEGFPEERWLDIRRIDLLAPILRARIDACRAKGFDGVDPDNLNGLRTTPASRSRRPINSASTRGWRMRRTRTS